MRSSFRATLSRGAISKFFEKSDSSLRDTWSSALRIRRSIRRNSEHFRMACVKAIRRRAKHYCGKPSSDISNRR
jgi:hypothetical protein